MKNLCTFSCPVCSFTTKSWKSIQEHWADSSHGGGGGGGGGGGDDGQLAAASDAWYHQCARCDEVMLCQTAVIREHVGRRHGMALGEYRAVAADAEAEGVERAEERAAPGGRAGQVERLKREVPAVIPPLSGMVMPGHLLREEQVTYEKANLCQYRCPTCSRRVDTFCGMRNHSQKAHSGGYYCFDRRDVVEARYHRCCICFKVVLCDNAVINQHTREAHRVGSRGYAELLAKFVASGRRPAFAIWDVPAVDPPFETMTLPRDALPDDRVTHKVESLCVYRCPSCSWETGSWGTLKGHVLTCGIPRPFLFDRRHVVEARYHRCCVCSAILLCDCLPITEHVGRAHDLNMEGYRALAAAKLASMSEVKERV